MKVQGNPEGEGQGAQVTGAEGSLLGEGPGRTKYTGKRAT